MGFRSDLLICTTLECETKEEMLAAIHRAKEEGANLVELCIDSMSFSHISEVEGLLRQRTLPSIVSFRYPPSFFPLISIYTYLFLHNFLLTTQHCPLIPKDARLV